MNAAKRRGWRRYAAHLGGYDVLGPTTKATLGIGRKTGLRYGGWREGETVPTRAAVAAVVGRRAEQIGPAAVGLTHLAPGGYYKGQSEPSTRVELIWTGEAREPTRKAFYRNVKKLAQDVASDLAQREVYIEVYVPGRRGFVIRTDRATPRAAPPAGEEARFCAWVRRFSRNAKTDPDDPCFARRRRSGA
jgi:hypothetical protein